MSSMPDPAPPEIRGFVEAATGDAVLGWAWSARRPQARVSVSLWLDDEELACAVADGAREDLARNGIGDGCHAFSLPVPQAARERLAELRVLGRVDGGDPVALGRPPAPEGVSERLDRLQRGVDVLAASQRVLHRNVQAALLGGRTQQDDASQRTSLAEQIASLELFVMRLDERLAALAPLAPANRPAAARGRLALAAALFAALLLGGAGLYRSLAG